MSDNFNEIKKRKPKRMFSHEEKKRIVEEFLESGLTASKFAPKYDIVMETLSKWKQDYKRSQQNPNQRLKSNIKRGGPYNEDLRRQAVEALSLIHI